MTGADAGSIFWRRENGKPYLRFKYSHTVSKELPYERFIMPGPSVHSGYVSSRA
jgi:hypothetical protein